MTLDELRGRLQPQWPVLDIHVHPLANFGPHAVNSAEEDAQLLIDAARRSGVRRMCLFYLGRPTQSEPSVEQCREANDYALAMQAAAPDVFVTFCYVNPAFPDAAVAEIDRCVANRQMHGIKLWVARRATD